jgi:hypothetical protein
VVGLLLAGGAFLLWRAGRNRLWREAGREVARRRPLALLVVCLFAVTALLDAVSWVGGGAAAGGGDVVSLHKPRSIIDRAFPIDFLERSYSAPLAAVSNAYHSLVCRDPVRLWGNLPQFFSVFLGRKGLLQVAGVNPPHRGRRRSH